MNEYSQSFRNEAGSVVYIAGAPIKITPRVSLVT